MNAGDTDRQPGRLIPGRASARWSVYAAEGARNASREFCTCLGTTSQSLYLAAIAGARRTIYIENQYFASRKIAEAMADRLRDPGGPEIILISPESAEGWLEEEVMGSSRACLLRLVQGADRHQRFRIYTPVTTGEQPIYVHAKVMIVDDRLLKVGSSNLNNRALGFDSECDLSVETSPDADPGLGQAIVGLRNDLLAEHLGAENAVVEEMIERSGGSVIRAIEELRSAGRSLVPLEAPEINAAEALLMEENRWLDPERPTRRWSSIRRGLRSLIAPITGS